MDRAISVLAPANLGREDSLDSVTLDSRARRRRRFRFTTDGGRELLLDLATAPCLSDGDGLLLEGGGVVLVRAALEDVMEIRAAEPAALAQIAWHLGNRHTPAEITPEAIYIERDHVLEEMVKGLGGRVRAIRRVFDPERGAYAGHGPAPGEDEGHV